MVQKKIDNGAVEAKTHGVERSPEWERIEKEHRAMEPACAACGRTTDIQIHHKFPFHYAIALGRPDLELDHRNLISLCETEKGSEADNHHLLIGHFSNFKEANLAVDVDAKVTYYGLSSQVIKESAVYQEAVKTKKLKALDKMTDVEKTDLRKLMDSTYPVAK